jgi:exodeoxyribonuclease V alpha subunit
MSSRYEIRVTSIYPSYERGVVEYRKFIGVIVSGLSKQATGRTIVEVKDSDDALFPIIPAVGQIWRVKGVATKSTIQRDGFLQTKIKIKPTRLKLLAPSGDAWIALIDKNVKGIASTTAQAIWDEVVVKRSDNLFRLLSDRNYDYFQSIKAGGRSLSFDQVDHLICFWKTYAHVDLIEWLIEKQLPAKLARRFALHYEGNSIRMIENDPYTLITFDSDFMRVDSIARNVFNLSLDDPRRLKAAVYSALYQHVAKGGHTVAARSDIERYIEPLLNDKLLIEKAFELSAHGNTYRYNKKTGHYHPIGLLAMEMVVAERIVALSRRKRGLTQSFYNSLSRSESKLGFKLADAQRKAVEACFENSLAIVTGGAGVGKTAVSKVIVETLSDSGEVVILTALSGRAVIRLRDATGRDTARTIASIEKDTKLHDNVNNAGFLLRSTGKFTLLIDEASMVDLPTLWRLFTYFNDNLSIIFVGDPQQLPPIGAGLLLHTLVDLKEISVSKLTIPQRFGKDTGIAEYASYVGKGIIPPALSFKNVHYHKINDLGKATEQAITTYLESPDSSQLLAATNDEIMAINKTCQAALNPDGKPLHIVFGDTAYQTEFRLSDPVIFTKNLWQYQIQNGKFGRITSVKNVSKVEDGKLVSTITGDSESVFGTIEMEDGLKVNITHEIINHFALSHCISAHKGQGSQFDTVIAILNDIYMVDRDWIYTTITRAKHSVHIFDPKRIFKKRVMNPGNASKRKTFLAELIRDEFNGIGSFDFESYMDAIEEESVASNVA